MTSLSSLFANRARAIAAGVVFACAVHMTGSVYGQWLGTNPTYVPAGTKVGIGQPNPVSWSALDVNGNIHGSVDIVAEGVFKNNTTSGSNYFLSKVGIGITAPLYRGDHIRFWLEPGASSGFAGV